MPGSVCPEPRASFLLLDQWSRLCGEPAVPAAVEEVLGQVLGCDLDAGLRAPPSRAGSSQSMRGCPAGPSARQDSAHPGQPDHRPVRRSGLGSDCSVMRSGWSLPPAGALAVRRAAVREPMASTTTNRGGSVSAAGPRRLRPGGPWRPRRAASGFPSRSPCPAYPYPRPRRCTTPDRRQVRRRRVSMTSGRDGRYFGCPRGEGQRGEAT